MAVETVRNTQGSRICQFGNFKKLCEDTWKSSRLKDRKIPTGWLRLAARSGCSTMSGTAPPYHSAPGQELDFFWQSSYGVSLLSSVKWAFLPSSRFAAWLWFPAEITARSSCPQCWHCCAGRDIRPMCCFHAWNTPQGLGTLSIATWKTESVQFLSIYHRLISSTREKCDPRYPRYIYDSLRSNECSCQMLLSISVELFLASVKSQEWDTRLLSPPMVLPSTSSLQRTFSNNSVEAITPRCFIGIKEKGSHALLSFFLLSFTVLCGQVRTLLWLLKHQLLGL